MWKKQCEKAMQVCKMEGTFVLMLNTEKDTKNMHENFSSLKQGVERKSII